MDDETPEYIKDHTKLEKKTREPTIKQALCTQLSTVFPYVAKTKIIKNYDSYTIHVVDIPSIMMTKTAMTVPIPSPVFVHVGAAF